MAMSQVDEDSAVFEDEGTLSQEVLSVLEDYLSHGVIKSRTYAKKRIMTPGGQWLPVRVIDSKHQIKGPGKFKTTVPLLDNSGVRVAAECIKEYINHKRNCNVLVTGDPGLGKSTIIGLCALMIDPDFSVDNVAFWLKDFEERFNTNPYGDGNAGIYPQINMDESAHALYGTEYMKEEQRVLAKNMIISRRKRNIVWFATPRRKLLNPHVREMVNVWIHVSEPKMFLPGYARMRFAPPEKQSEFYAEKFWEPKCAFIFPEMTGDWWDRYEEKKIEFIQTAPTKKPSKELEDFESRVVKNLRTKAGMSQAEVAAIIERNQSTVSRIESSSSSPS